MCLIVTHVPSSKKAGRVVKCWKKLAHSVEEWSWVRGYHTVKQGRPITPYQKAAIPLDGLLKPKHRLRKGVYYCARLEGGLIHAFQAKRLDEYGDSLNTLYEASGCASKDESMNGMRG